MPKKSALSKGRHVARADDIYYHAQAILARRSHSVAEVRQKLSRRGFVSADIAAVIEKLLEAKLLDDRIFAQQYARDSLRRQAYGPRWLMRKLQQYGVDRAVITSVLAAEMAEARPGQLIERAAATWRRRHRSPLTGSRLASLNRFLLSRGFRGSDVQEYISNLRDEA